MKLGGFFIGYNFTNILNCSSPSSLWCSALSFCTAVPLLLYGIQHYLSLAGSLIFIPLIIVPAMGGSDVSLLRLNQLFPTIICLATLGMWWQEETATVISTMLLVSGVTTILQLYFGTRLPLVQGSSFVYLAPALVIINSEDFRNLSENVSSVLVTAFQIKISLRLFIFYSSLYIIFILSSQKSTFPLSQMKILSHAITFRTCSMSTMRWNTAGH